MKSDYIEKLREKREIWLNCLNKDDTNSIIQQVFKMIWNFASFNIINEARKYAYTASNGGVQLNWLMHSLINRCFFDSQLMAIRRLTDRYPLYGKEGVHSLAALIDDIKNNRNLFTRESILKVEGLEYDYISVRKKAQEYIDVNIKDSPFSGLPQELDWEIIRERHEQIDILSGVDDKTRSLKDTIKQDIFDHLYKKLDCISEIREYVDTFIAHAATKESRDSVNADDIRITLSKLKEAHKNICIVVNYVSQHILGNGVFAFLDITNIGDKFAYIDNPLISKDKIHILEEEWARYETEVLNWSGFTKI